MSQKRKDSTKLKGEMTMITQASKLKKVPVSYAPFCKIGC